MKRLPRISAVLLSMMLAGSYVASRVTGRWPFPGTATDDASPGPTSDFEALSDPAAFLPGSKEAPVFLPQPQELPDVDPALLFSGSKSGVLVLPDSVLSGAPVVGPEGGPNDEPTVHTLLPGSKTARILPMPAFPPVEAPTPSGSCDSELPLRFEAP